MISKTVKNAFKTMLFKKSFQRGEFQKLLFQKCPPPISLQNKFFEHTCFHKHALKQKVIFKKNAFKKIEKTCFQKRCFHQDNFKMLRVVCQKCFTKKCLQTKTLSENAFENDSQTIPAKKYTKKDCLKWFKNMLSTNACKHAAKQDFQTDTFKK